jgi:SET family sugar efflux transporter-like MFS transporter
MIASFTLIARDPTLRLIALLMALFGAINSSTFPYQSMVAIDRIGMSRGHFALVLVLASVVAVASSVVAGIITDQRANRRQVALVTASATVLGPALMIVAPGPVSLVLCHGLLLPLSGSLFGQCFALARLACSNRPTERDAILAAVRSLLSLTFLIVLPLWSIAFSFGVDVMAVYWLAALCGLVLLALTWSEWPRDGETHWADPPSGLNLLQSLREMADGRVQVRIGLLGAITAANALYMVLISLIFSATTGRGPADVALFVALVAGFEVPFMLLMPWMLRLLSRSRLIVAGGILYACHLALMPVLAPTALIWVLPLIAGLAGAATLTLPIAYLQDLMGHRPGAGSSLMALQKVIADIICAAVFAAGSALAGYGGAALLGAGIAIAGSLALLWADRHRAPG